MVWLGLLELFEEVDHLGVCVGEVEREEHLAGGSRGVLETQSVVWFPILPIHSILVVLHLRRHLLPLGATILHKEHRPHPFLEQSLPLDHTDYVEGGGSQGLELVRIVEPLVVPLSVGVILEDEVVFAVTDPVGVEQIPRLEVRIEGRLRCARVVESHEVQWGVIYHFLQIKVRVYIR